MGLSQQSNYVVPPLVSVVFNCSRININSIPQDSVDARWEASTPDETKEEDLQSFLWWDVCVSSKCFIFINLWYRKLFIHGHVLNKLSQD